MQKVIFVIDDPEICDNCPLVQYCHNNDGKCDLSIKQSWCPLKPLPEKEKSFENDEYLEGYSDGYNTCINHILKMYIQY